MINYDCHIIRCLRFIPHLFSVSLHVVTLSYAFAVERIDDMIVDCAPESTNAFLASRSLCTVCAASWDAQRPQKNLDSDLHIILDIRQPKTLGYVRLCIGVQRVEIQSFDLLLFFKRSWCSCHVYLPQRHANCLHRHGHKLKLPFNTLEFSSPRTDKFLVWSAVACLGSVCCNYSNEKTHHMI